jgi:hypothetical protein
VRVGREPFDEAARRALEAQNPGVSFDWKAIVETPIPSADTERWRERRRAEKALKHAAAEEDLAEIAKADAGSPTDEPETSLESAPAQSIDASAAEDAPVDPSSPIALPVAGDATRRRRRRRRGRREPGRERQAPRETGAPSEPAARAEPAEPPEPVGD